MKFLKTIFASTVLSTLVVGSLSAAGFGFNLGPFNMQFNASTDDYYVANKVWIDSPICGAISRLKQLELTVEGAENISSKEKKIIVKKIVVEPYGYGVTDHGKPVLQGNVVSETVVKEVTVKYGDDRFDDKVVPLQKSNEGFFAGLFSSNGTNIDIRQVTEIRVIDNSHFNPPSNYKGMTGNNITVICQLPIHN